MISVHRVNGTNLSRIIHERRQNGKRTRATESVIRNNAKSFPYITQTWWMALAAMRCEATHGVCRRRGVIGTPACQGWRIAPKVYTISRARLAHPAPPSSNAYHLETKSAPYSTRWTLARERYLSLQSRPKTSKSIHRAARPPTVSRRKKKNVCMQFILRVMRDDGTIKAIPPAVAWIYRKS